mmetsp:Transcript_25665/g.68144  ORF Transcript_25665/g.68144 Transcript_25665/m.68144 type:complete len:332 (-) Transcript_25665:331-1326(-)
MAERSASVIFLHGLGDSGAAWGSLQHEAPLTWARWSFPDAPRQPVSCNGGASMPSWFDIDELPLGDRESAGAPKGIERSVSMVHAMLKQSEALGFPASRTVLGGFSQGAALSLLAGLTYEKPLAGIIALSGWAMRRSELPTLLRQRGVPVFLGHGEADPTVPCSLGRAAERALKAAGCTAVELRTFPGLGHSACPPEFRAVHGFLRSCLPERFEADPPKAIGPEVPLSAASRTKVVVGRPAPAPAAAAPAPEAVPAAPTFELKEENGLLLISVYLPGVAGHELEVDLSPGKFRLGGARSLEVKLPCNVDPDRATTKLSKRRAVLSISAPVA